MYTDEDTVELDYSYEESEEEEPQAKRPRYRQVVFRSPEELAVDGDKTSGGQPDPEAAAVRETQREEAEDPPAPVTTASGRHCPAVGCAYEGDEEARVAHWRGSHLEVLPLWMCPVGRCKNKCRSKEALLSHLKGKRHKYPVSTVERIMQLPPLVEMVQNHKFQAPVDVTPLAGPEEVPEEALPFKNKADLGAQVGVILQSRNVGKVLLPTPAAAAFDVKDWMGLLGLPPPPPPPLPPAEPVKEVEVAEIPLPPLPPPPPEDTIPDQGPPTDEDRPPLLDEVLPLLTEEDRSPEGLPEEDWPPPPAVDEDRLPLLDEVLPLLTEEDRSPEGLPEEDRPPPPAAGDGLPSPVEVEPQVPPPSLGPDLDATRGVMPPPPPLPAPAAEEPPPAASVPAAEDPPLAAPATAAEEQTRPQVRESPPQHPLSSGSLRTQARRLDMQVGQLQRQRHDVMEAAFYAMKQDIQRVGRDNEALRLRVSFLEAELRGYERNARPPPGGTAATGLQLQIPPPGAISRPYSGLFHGHA